MIAILLCIAFVSFVFGFSLAQMAKISDQKMEMFHAQMKHEKALVELAERLERENMGIYPQNKSPK